MALAPKPRAASKNDRSEHPARVTLIATLDGEDFPLRTKALTALDVGAFRKACGISTGQLFTTITDESGVVDIDTVAQVVWLSRRQQGDRYCDYNSLAESVSLDGDPKKQPGIRFATEAEQDEYDGIEAGSPPV